MMTWKKHGQQRPHDIPQRCAEVVTASYRAGSQQTQRSQRQYNLLNSVRVPLYGCKCCAECVELRSSPLLWWTRKPETLQGIPWPKCEASLYSDRSFYSPC